MRVIPVVLMLCNSKMSGTINRIIVELLSKRWLYFNDVVDFSA